MLSAQDRLAAESRNRDRSRAIEARIAEENRNREIWRVKELAQAWSPHHPDAPHVVGTETSADGREIPVWRDFRGDVEAAAHAAVDEYVPKLLDAVTILRDLGVSTIGGLKKLSGIDGLIWEYGIGVWEAALTGDRIKLYAHILECFPWPSWKPENCPFNKEDRRQLRQVMTVEVLAALEEGMGWNHRPEPDPDDYTKQYSIEELRKALPQSKQAQTALDLLYGNNRGMVFEWLMEEVSPNASNADSFRRNLDNWSAILLREGIHLEFGRENEGKSVVLRRLKN